MPIYIMIDAEPVPNSDRLTIEDWPDAVLAIVPKGHLLPGAGGRVGCPGEAVAGYASARPLPIWCVLEEAGHREQRKYVAKAIARGLKQAARRGCTSVGLILDPRRTNLIPGDELAKIALRTFNEHSETSALSGLYLLSAMDQADPSSGQS
jgi:hypothetical protein